MELNTRDVIRSAAGMFRDAWRRLLLVHVGISLVTILLLVPLWTALLGWLVLASGDVALTDEDILFFVLSPLGGVLFLLVGTVQLTLLVFEQAAMILAATQQPSVTTRRATALIRALLSRFLPVFRLAFVLVLKLCLIAAPFGLLAFAIYRGLLGAYDINYYLTYKPPEFWLAAVLVAGTLAVMAWLWIRVLFPQLLVLPLVILAPGLNDAATRARAKRVAGTARRSILQLLAAWLAASAVLLMLAGAVASLGSAMAIRLSGQSLQLLAYLLGVVLLLWGLAQFAATFLSAGFLGVGLLSVARTTWPELTELAQTAPQDSPDSRSSMRLPAGVFAFFALIAIGLAGWALVQVAQRQGEGHEPQVIAHRGASARAPENTLASVRLAIEQDADWVEIDVQQTRDDRIAVIHDSDLMKVGGSPLRVKDATLAELQAVDIGSYAGSEFADQRIPTLEQVLELARGQCGVIIELKYYGGEKNFEQQVAGIIERAGVQDQVELMSLNLPGVRAMKALRPDWQVGLLSSVGVGDLSQLDVDFFAVNATLAARPFVRRTHDRGKQVFAWTINDPALMSTMAGRELDGIITDDPALARKVFEQRKELSLHELLLIQLASLLGSRFDVPQ